MAVVCIFEHAILRAVKGPRSGLLIRILPIAAVNSGVLGTVLVERTQSFTLAQSIGFGLGSGLGYLLAVMLVTEAGNRLRSKAIPEAFRGLPITLIYIGVLALAIYTRDRIIVVDPMGEYSPLIKRLGGQVIEIAPDSPHHINPMDIDLSFDEENPMALKADFILSLMELIVGGKDGLQPVERTVIDRCVRQMYREHLQDPETSKMPTLQTLYDLLCSQPEGEAVRLATALEIYVSGSLNVFNHETNVDLNRRLVCLDLKKLGAGLRTIAMLIMQDLVNSQVSMNFLRGIATWCYFDEFHVLLRDRLTASYCVAIWKMLRKKGCVPSALTQNVKDFLASPEIENIFENSDFLVLLSQAQGDRQILAKQLGISPHQLSYVTHTNSGEGLLFFGNTTIPFVDRFPQNTELYAIMTTRPEDKKQEMNRA